MVHGDRAQRREIEVDRIKKMMFVSVTVDASGGSLEEGGSSNDKTKFAESNACESTPMSGGILLGKVTKSLTPLRKKMNDESCGMMVSKECRGRSGRNGRKRYARQSGRQLKKLQKRC